MYYGGEGNLSPIFIPPKYFWQKLSNFSIWPVTPSSWNPAKVSLHRHKVLYLVNNVLPAPLPASSTVTLGPRDWVLASRHKRQATPMFDFQQHLGRPSDCPFLQTLTSQVAYSPWWSWDGRASASLGSKESVWRWLAADPTDMYSKLEANFIVFSHCLQN